MLPGHLIFPDFFANARELRAAFDAHFADPARHSPETHQIWNYWNVPELYTYLRTQPEKVIPRPLCDEFFASLERLALERFGLTRVSWPYLSLYVTGCSQGLHNDARGGRLGFVYSLTNWESRRFDGGETLIFREERYFGSPAITAAAAATRFYDLVPAHFNQLLVFDDRLPHAVPRLEGTMVPQEGRVVLHGHFSEGPPAVAGALAPARAQAVIDAALKSMRPRIVEASKGLAGLLTLKLLVSAEGKVDRIDVLFDRLLAIADDAVPPEAAIAAALEAVRAWRFPPSGGASTLVVALPIGDNPLP